ncbi:VC2046/SO_2500 family protein [Paraglaciecola sp. L3A3]|uniref:VC2046/SO_2500 family protein n=1 Tax=Paraglaciecola sp. L3A3 TaxID=2686358 RepID=UPI00131BEAEE|nr:VC2046/SO_2500 family protein [Paraglaciecola sp. L3A3]
MLDSTHQAEPFSSGGVDPVNLVDRELNGEINRAATQGAKFSLLLAMLEQNTLNRPQLEAQVEVNQDEKPILHYYRSPPLVAEVESWQHFQQTSELVNSGHVQSAHLWLMMHPQPLSRRNDPLHVDDNIVANCSYPTQIRLQQEQQRLLKIDETGLYDILQELTPSAA